MTEAQQPPNIPNSFLGGTLVSGTGAFITAGSYTLLSGHKNPLRYSVLTSINVGVIAGLFTGTLRNNVANEGVRACLLRLPGLVQKRQLVDGDYVFASGIAAGFVGGTFNLFNSRNSKTDFVDEGGPRMVIPGLFIFSMAGFAGQLIINFCENMRARYVFENEQRWMALKKGKTEVSLRDNVTEWERRFEYFGKFTGIKKADPVKRLTFLRGEIERLDNGLQQIEDEIARLEKLKQEQEGKQ